MALVACPECGRQVSSAAIACPSCAYPLQTKTGEGARAESIVATRSASNAAPDQVKDASESTDDQKPDGMVLGTVAFVLLVGAVGFSFVLSPSTTPVPSSSTSATTSTSKVSSRLAQEAFQALKKLQASTESGITIGEYNRQRAEVWYHVKAYLESPEAEARPDVRKAFGDAITAYNKAATLWRVTIEQPAHTEWYEKGKDPYWAMRLRDEIPELDKFRYWQGNDFQYKFKQAIPWYWEDAAKALQTVAARFP